MSEAQEPPDIDDFNEAIDNAFTCPKCGAEMDWTDCEVCDGTGYSGHDCGEDCCCCLDPEENQTCHQCGGEGGWWYHVGKCVDSDSANGPAVGVE